MLQQIVENPRTTHDLILNWIGVNSFHNINPEIDQADDPSEIFLRQNPNRVAFTIVNMSANIIQIAVGVAAAADNGIFLAANGGMLNMKWLDDLELVTMEWWAFAAAAASDIYVIEQVITPKPFKKVEG